MKYTVLGAGMMGSAVAYDLAKAGPEDQIVLADVSFDTAARSARAIGPTVTPQALDVGNDRLVHAALRGSAAVVSAVSYAVNLQLTRTAIDARVPMVDLGGNNDIVLQQRGMHAEAAARGVTIIPNAGLAPGLVNILAMTGFQEMDATDAIHLRVGGLPLHPHPPLNYQIVFSPEGLINEYVERATVLHEGRVREVDSLTGLETIEFPPPFGTLEAFSTSGGVSVLPELLQGKVRTLDYKTIRYPGHCEKFKTLLDLGFAASEPLQAGASLRTHREYFIDLLWKKLDFREPDVVLLRATIAGRKSGVPTTITYECVDHYDTETKMTAMMRTTAFPVAVIARMLGQGVITEHGVLPPESCVPGNTMIAELARRCIVITKRTMETSP
jgi:lysine 6-dehydrogenase